ncbi:MAG: replication-associated recombination protein A [Bacilli bacterium]|nr:replication-associated recombination protein A [Bacilli bacterium]
MATPLADLIRPTSLEEMVGQEHLFGKDSVFRKTISRNIIPNMIFYGPPGVGKTTVANIIAKNTEMLLYKLNGTTANLDDIKKVIDDSKSVFAGKGVLLYLDEIQYFNKKQQQSLLEYVEKGLITLIASTTENPYFYIYPALISRCSVFEFKQITKSDIKKGLKRVVDIKNIKITNDAIDLLAGSANGDMRKAINNLEFLYNALGEDKKITVKEVNEVVPKANISYDRGEDKHYDHLSAFMKSLRGSDPDAAIFYLAKMLEAGDIVAVSRRLLCSVNEDVGLAYPQLIPIVKSCVDTALQLGMPEAKLPLSNATILIATAPKSNSSYMAYARAVNDIELGKGLSVPRCLQNTHFDGEDAAIKGQNYKYPHDYKNHWVKQQYLPDDIKDVTYYIYGDNKLEQATKEYWEKIKK